MAQADDDASIYLEDRTASAYLTQARASLRHCGRASSLYPRGFRESEGMDPNDRVGVHFRAQARQIEHARNAILFAALSAEAYINGWLVTRLSRRPSRPGHGARWRSTPTPCRRCASTGTPKCLRRPSPGDAYEDRDLVFADKLGGVIYPNRLTDWFAEHRKAAGIPTGSLHTLRHTAASVALTSGVPVHIVAARLGDDPKTVLGTYAHLLPQSDELAAERVAMAIAG